VTGEERRILATQVPDARFTVLPTAHTPREGTPGPEGRSGLLFVGGFEHLPNIDAAIWMAEEIMPRVRRELGDVTLRIAGGSAPDRVLALDGDDIEVLGWVKDLDPLIDATRVMVAPLRYGAGMKGKVTQSLAAGLPVVTTAIGAEGLGARDGEQLLVADDADGFADAVCRLYRDDELWRGLAHAGRGLAEERCSPAILRARLAELLAP
jgi:glycosyltransferase involved in cell wall biosynthesis